MSANALSAEMIQCLIEKAQLARLKAYAPYSNYLVGAALLAENDEIFTGCNVENAAYPVGICAERTAVVKAVSEGCTSFQAIIVVTEDGGTPCGECRQVLNEFSPTMLIFMVNSAGELLGQKTLQELLPEGFGPANLKKSRLVERAGDGDRS